MKDPARNGGVGSRIASVHNGSSLFTGVAGSGESNIRRYLIENDLLEGIIQLPNNLFYNTGITTYIWLLNNAKPDERRGRVILIDASELYTKLRKNLGAKNCEFTPEHIALIQQTFADFQEVDDLGADAGAGGTGKEQATAELRAKVFNGEDFGYYKATIERPERLKTQITPERIAELRFDKSLREPMTHAYETYGDDVYTRLPDIKDELLAWCEKNDLNLTTKNRKMLTTLSTWTKGRDLLTLAHVLLDELGQEVFKDFNRFQKQTAKAFKTRKLKVGAADKKKIYNVITEYDPAAEKVIKKIVALKGDKLTELLDYLYCEESDLPYFGYYPHGGKTGQFVTYEASSDLRDTESVPLNENIQDYFMREVHPHVPEAWIDIGKTKIGYEISFNKYFYRHQPLRTLEEVSADIRALEEENEGLIGEILKMV